MASMPSPGLRPPLADHTDPAKFPSKAFKFLYADPPRPIVLFPQARKPSSPSPPPSARSPGSLLCRCRQPGRHEDSDEGGGGPGRPRWDALIQDVVRSAVKRWDDYVSSYRRGSGSWSVEGPQESASKVGKGAKRAKEQGDSEECGEDWDWDRWLQHFAEVEEQERLVLAIKSQLRDAIFREDYGDAAKLKLTLAKATENDAVGVAMSELNRAIKEERYSDAARIRDHAGAGLVGWWAGISGGGVDPFGRIIHISAEYGKYVAKSYSPRQLATGRQGVPLFEVYFTTTNGEHKQQPAFLKRKEYLGNNLKAAEKRPDFSSFSSSSAPTKENTLRNEDEKSVDDDLNISGDLSSIQNILRDIIPGVRLKVLKVVAPAKVDKDIIAKVIEQIIEEDVDDNDEDLETVEIEDDEDEDDIEEIEIDAEDVTIAQEKKSEVSLNVVISALIPKVSADVLPENLIRVPARIEKRDYKSFSFVVEKDKKHDIERKLQDMRKMSASQRSADILISDLAKTITSKEKAHMKVLRDIGELINLAVNQKQNYHSLSGVTHFSRIEIPSISDPLSGLYVGTHGMYSSNVLHLERKFGQWQEDNALQLPVELEFYEYVEAIKLTGDPSVPAGQVAFRAKVGKRYQLPHKGIIPEEFGVVARYKGQGRLADPGFQNPRWVDGELVILDGKYIRAGPVIGFVYWAPESHFLLFFNRLKLLC